MKPTRDSATCTISDCESPVLARSWCSKHWQRWQKHGDPNYARPAKGVDPCIVDDCDTLASALGMCSRHYKALREYPSCEVDACDKPAQQTRYCYAHYNRWKRHGDPTHGGPLRRRARNGEGGYTPEGYRVFTVKGVRYFEHRVVMERILGRPLLATETVHHINGVRDDNRPENLELWTTYQPHGQRVTDLVDFVATYYAAEVAALIKEKNA